ncbi:MAG: heterodisulfide reductase [Desulfobacteraceae bacterium]|jgi:heterodisulfide reductase subunit C|nr:MAG: heterodisulfide reductase [Desulfobacteraceae bacterium]
MLNNNIEKPSAGSPQRELQWQQRLYETPGGREILGCIQCGTCSASCPLTDQMDHAPRELFALVRDGAMEEVLRSNTPWFCVSCYQCMVRCPREIPVTDIMYALKRMAAEAGIFPKGHKMPGLYKIFNQDVARYGKITGSILMGRYGLRHPVDMASKMGTGLGLLKTRRFDFTPQKMVDPRKIAALLKRKRTHIK